MPLQNATWNAKHYLRRKGFTLNVIRIRFFTWGVIAMLVKLGLYAIKALLSGIVEIGPEVTLAFTIVNSVLSGLILGMWGFLAIGLIDWLVQKVVDAIIKNIPDDLIIG